jgi:hypothetical protein
VEKVFLLALLSALYPTLFAAVLVMLELESPKPLLLGYLAGSLLTSIALGLVIVFTLKGSSGGTSAAKNTANPILDLTLGAFILVAVFVVATERDQRRRARSARRKAAAADKRPPRWKAALSRGSARTTFVVGALIALPGATYLAALEKIHDQGLSTSSTVLVVIAFNAIMFVLVEIPLAGYAVAPVPTRTTIGRLNEALSRNGGRIALVAAIVISVALLARGVVSLAG